MASFRPFTPRSTPGTHNPKPYISEKARQRPVRVIPADDRAEMEAGHLTASGSLFSSNMLLSRPGASSKDSYDGASYGGGSSYESAAAYQAAPASESEADTNEAPADTAGGEFTAFGDSSSTDDLR